ncbi:MAG: molybdopterin-dependent oxidoreductase, partial [Pseudomonadota bacterium]
LRPGTDAALAFAFMHIAQRDGLLDMDFIAEKTLGFEEIEPEIRTADPVWAERVTGVPSGQIEEAAHLYCQGPSLLWLGQGLQRTTFGGNAFRSLATLAATTGNLIGQGCGLTYMNGPNTRGVDMDYLTADHLRDGPAPHLSHLDMPDRLLDPGQSEALFCWNNNILASSPRQSDLRDALQRKDLLHVCVDLFHTDTTQYADYVLPAASFLEFDDLVIPYFHHTLSAQKQVAPQFGEALPNQEIFRRLARSLGLEALELYEDDATMLNTLVAQTPFEGDFSDLAKIGTARLLTAPREQFGGEGIPTPSGRVEIASSSAENDGLPRTPFAHADAAAQDSKLRILSPASKWLMNSSYGNDERIRQRLGRQQIIVHPTDCSQRALEDGDEVLVHNDTGELRAVVCISETVQPGVAVIYKGSWPKHTGGKNVNVLNPGRKSDIAESSAVHSIEAHVARVSQSA